MKYNLLYNARRNKCSYNINGSLCLAMIWAPKKRSEAEPVYIFQDNDTRLKELTVLAHGEDRKKQKFRTNKNKLDVLERDPKTRYD
jgi:hypothetical protein